MNCIFCKKPAGFLKGQHEECYNKTQEHIKKIEQIANQYNREISIAKDVKKVLKELAASNELYKNYLEHNIFDKTAIRTNEIAIYCEDMISISESKNRCTMERTGLSYERHPIWEVDNLILCENGQIVFTDKSIYLLLDRGHMIYSYNKIVNIGFDEKLHSAYFDIKTSSPFPHRFTIKSTIKKDKIKAPNVCMFLNCLTGL